MNDDQIKEILKNSKTIAMIGVSSEKKGEDPKNLKRKPANVVMKYMQDFGYKVIPVNPFAKGEVINGETVVETDIHGHYEIEAEHGIHSFLFITTPARYVARSEFFKRISFKV